MNDLELLDRYGPDAPPPSDATLTAARARLLAAMDTSATPRRGLLPIRRRLVLAGLGLAAAVAVAAVVTAPRPDQRPDATPTTVPSIAVPPTSASSPAGGIRLVAATAPAFPWTLPGLGDAAFTADPDGPVIAIYLADDRSDVYLAAATADERTPGFGGESADVEINGRPGRVMEFNGASDGPRPLTLVWEHDDGVWLRLTGHGRYGTTEALTELAGRVEDEPQRLHFEVTVGLIPDGWELAAFKDESILMYRDPADPAVDFQVQWAPKSEPLFRAAEMDGIEKASKVTVGGRKADLFQCRDFWMVQTRLADGSAVRVSTPRTFTSEQVRQLAESVRRG
ncbi:hypothetical protein [Actinoplanes subglobosus]|uniref:Uncharacterized protein n=1 Tax=Actinoplanes subglobosus TaxID=1547892 RepID=A0ABV8J7I3_9ACTN